MDITTTLHYIKDHAQWYDYPMMIITVLIFISPFILTLKLYPVPKDITDNCFYNKAMLILTSSAVILISLFICAGVFIAYRNYSWLLLIGIDVLYIAFILIIYYIETKMEHRP